MACRLEMHKSQKKFSLVSGKKSEKNDDDVVCRPACWCDKSLTIYIDVDVHVYMVYMHVHLSLSLSLSHTHSG
jgi:hypothetical protein